LSGRPEGSESRVARSGLTAETLLKLPVEVRGIRVGWPVDMIIDAEGGRALGLDVLCGDESHRFLPLAAARVRSDSIEVGSALTLLADAERDFYRHRGSTLRELRARRGVRDVALGEGWRIEELLAEEPAPA
jgi:hypothetical protein